MTAPELKPCPFCGCDNLKIWDNSVECVNPNCGASGPDLGHCVGAKCRTEAISAWNTRAIDPAVQELIDAYEDIMDYGIVFAKKDQQDRLKAAKEKLANG